MWSDRHLVKPPQIMNHDFIWRDHSTQDFIHQTPDRKYLTFSIFDFDQKPKSQKPSSDLFEWHEKPVFSDLKEYLSPLLTYYPWVVEPPVIETYERDNHSYIFGTFHHMNDNTQQWFWVYMLYKISLKFPLYLIRCWDLEDEDVIFVHHFNNVPKYFEVNFALNRLWIKNGELLTLEESPGDVLLLDDALKLLVKNQYKVDPNLNRAWKQGFENDKSLRLCNVDQIFERYINISLELVLLFKKYPFAILGSIMSFFEFYEDSNYNEVLAQPEMETLSRVFPQKLVISKVNLNLIRGLYENSDFKENCSPQKFNSLVFNKGAMKFFDNYYNTEYERGSLRLKYETDKENNEKETFVDKKSLIDLLVKGKYISEEDNDLLLELPIETDVRDNYIVYRKIEDLFSKKSKYEKKKSKDEYLLTPEKQKMLNTMYFQSVMEQPQTTFYVEDVYKPKDPDDEQQQHKEGDRQDDANQYKENHLKFKDYNDESDYNTDTSNEYENEDGDEDMFRGDKDIFEDDIDDADEVEDDDEFIDDDDEDDEDDEFDLQDLDNQFEEI